MAKNLAKLCFVESRVFKGGIGYLAELISKQSVEQVDSFLLTAYSKNWEDINDLKTELLIKKKGEVEEWEYS